MGLARNMGILTGMAMTKKVNAKNPFKIKGNPRGT